MLSLLQKQRDEGKDIALLLRDKAYKVS